jgi:hypothetical protein
MRLLVSAIACFTFLSCSCVSILSSWFVVSVLFSYTLNIPQKTTEVNNYFNKNENSCKSLSFLILWRAYFYKIAPVLQTTSRKRLFVPLNHSESVGETTVQSSGMTGFTC